MNPFAQTLENNRPPTDTVAVYWLEQSHFIFQLPGGTLIHTDPFLARIVDKEFLIHSEPLVPPEKARADFIFLTHDHDDHTDRHTLEPMAKANPECLFIGTREAADRCLRECGVEKDKIEAMQAGDQKTFRLPQKENFADFSVQAVYARDTDDPPATTHLGYVFDFNGIRIYHVGDTRKNPETYADQFAAIQNLRPDAMLVPINEGYNNPGPKGAAWFLEKVQPRIAVPCHYGCFSNNTIDPALFVQAATPALAERIQMLPRGGCLMVKKT